VPSTLDQLLSLDRLSTGDPLAAFEFAHPLPAWAWAFIVPASLLFALLTYFRLSGPRLPRASLAILRAALVVLLALLLSGPQLAKQTERIEKDWVVFLVDRSLSLGVADAPPVSGPNPTTSPTTRPTTRDEQLRRTLDTFAPQIAALRGTRNVAAAGFGASTFDLTAAFSASPPSLPPVAGRATRLSEAIDQSLSDFAGRPVSAFVVFSDGRTPESVIAPQRLAALTARGIPIFAIPLGSDKAVADLSILRAEAPTLAFLKDSVPIGVTIAVNGESAEDAQANLPLAGTLELFDEDTGATIDSRPLAEPDPSATPLRSGTARAFRFTFLKQVPKAGAVRWGVRIVPTVADLSATNNSAPVRIEFADQPIRVLYLDGYPRWEYRYLKNTLVREDEQVRSSILILSPDRRFIREGSDPIDAAPRTLEDWSAFDAIILGDVRPELFSDSQVSQLRTLIAERGAGLIWLGGPAAVPSAWNTHPLADLLPFTPGPAGDAGIEAGKPWLDPVLLRPAPAARRYGVLQLSDSPTTPWPGWLSDGSLNWTFLRYAQRFDKASLKPTTEVLAESFIPAPSDSASPAASSPLVMTMRYGAGRIVYVATDEIWRLRYGRGETLPERFWIPLVRLAARESLGRSGRSAVIELSPSTATAGLPVRITLRLLDQSLVDAASTTLRIRITRRPAPGEPASQIPPLELTLLRQSERPADAFQDAASIGTFAATFTPTDPGFFDIDSPEPLLGASGLAAALEVVLPDDELRLPQTNHPLLATLATETGGAVVLPDQISTLPDLLPNREVRILGVPEVETLWDTPLAWTLFILLICLELMGRRLVRLA